MKSKAKPAVPAKARVDVIAWVFLAALAGLVLLRLFIWKFFRGLEAFVKEDLSNLICAGAILGVALLYYGRKLVRGEPFQKTLSRFEPALILWFAAAVISFFTSFDRASTLRHVTILFSYILLFFMLKEVLAERARWWAFFIFMVICSVIIAVLGIQDYLYLISRPVQAGDEMIAKTNDSLFNILTTKRACSLFGWPNVLAGYLNIMMPLVLAATITARQWWAKLLMGASLLSMAACLLVTFSFFGWLSLLVGFLVALVTLSFSWKGLGRGIKIGLCTFLVATLVMFVYVTAKKDFRSSSVPRRQYIQAAVNSVSESPIFGTGVGTFAFTASKHAKTRDGLSAFTHNSYLQLWVEAGLPGFLASLLLLATLIWMLRRHMFKNMDISQRVWFAAFVWLWASFFFDNLGSFTLLKPNISIFFWVALGMFAGWLTVNEAVVSERRKGNRLACLALLVAIVLALTVSVQGIAAFYKIRRAFALEQRGQTADALDAFREAHEFYPIDYRFSFEGGKRLVNAYRQTGQRRYLDEAEIMLLDSAKRAPFFGNRLILGLIYQAYGRKEEAINMMKEGFRLAPNESFREMAPFRAQSK